MAKFNPRENEIVNLKNFLYNIIMKKQEKRIQKGVAAIATNTSTEVPTAAAQNMEYA